MVDNDYGTFKLDDRTVYIKIPGNPVTKKNSQKICYKYVGGKKVPFISPSDTYRHYKEFAGFYIKDIGIDYPVNVKTVFYMETRRKVDLSNLIEAAHDIMVECGCLADDNYKIIQSVDGSRVYYDKANPRTEIWITPATEGENGPNN